MRGFNTPTVTNIKGFKKDDISVILDDEPWIQIKLGAYNPSFVEDLKNDIPVKAWDPETKSWYIPLKYIEELISLSKSYFPNTKIDIQCEPTKKNTSVKSENDLILGMHASLGLRLDCPDQVLHATYKALATLLDPAKNNGDSSRLNKIKFAYEAICRHRKLKSMTED